MNTNPTLLRIAATIAFTITLIMNALANILPINGLNTGQVSDLYPSLFTPAGITFSIWSVIYLLLLAFLIYAWVHRTNADIDRILPWFIVNCLLNASWILVWHYLMIEVSVLIMLTLLGTLVRIFHLGLHMRFTRSQRAFVVVPFTTYFAWICVATIANISALLVSYGWDGSFLSETAWTVIMMAVAAALATIILFKYKKFEFVLVVMWALTGIYLRSKVSDNGTIIYAAMSLVALLAVEIGIKAIRLRRSVIT